MQPEVRHEPAAARFVAVVDGMTCRADYRLDGGTMYVVHTEVPPALEGRGIAGALVREVFEHARREGLAVAPVCSYVKAWARRHPEVSSLIAPGWG